jgi:hypothetical protein
VDHNNKTTSWKHPDQHHRLSTPGKTEPTTPVLQDTAPAPEFVESENSTSNVSIPTSNNSGGHISQVRTVDEVSPSSQPVEAATRRSEGDRPNHLELIRNAPNYVTEATQGSPAAASKETNESTARNAVNYRFDFVQGDAQATKQETKDGNYKTARLTYETKPGKNPDEKGISNSAPENLIDPTEVVFDSELLLASFAPSALQEG